MGTGRQQFSRPDPAFACINISQEPCSAEAVDLPCRATETGESGKEPCSKPRAACPGALPFGRAAGASPHPQAHPPGGTEPGKQAGPARAFLHGGFSSPLLPAVHPHGTASKLASCVSQRGTRVRHQRAKMPVKQVLITRSATRPSAGLAEAGQGCQAAPQNK